MKVPKRHHFVSQMHLRRFADKNGQLHFYDKRIPERGILSSTPANLFVEGHLYTQQGKDGQKDISVETMFAGLEGQADKIIKKIIRAARNGNLPNLTTEEKAFWDHFFYYQWKRVPDVHNKTLSQSEFEDNVRDSLDWYESNVRPLTAVERERINDPTAMARLKKDARVRALAVPGDEAVRILGDKGLGVVIIRKPKKSFVIGSNPVVKLTHPGRSHLADPSVEAWLPLATDVAVSPGLSRGKEKLVELTEDSDIRYINKATFKQSTTIAGRSRSLIASLASVR